MGGGWRPALTGGVGNCTHRRRMHARSRFELRDGVEHSPNYRCAGDRLEHATGKTTIGEVLKLLIEFLQFVLSCGCVLEIASFELLFCGVRISEKCILEKGLNAGLII